MSKHVSLDIFNYSYQKVCNLYDSEITTPGSAHDITLVNEITGWKTLTFTLPYVLDEGTNNYRWDFVKNEYLIR